MCVVFNLELAALACSTAVFFLCEHQRYQSVCKAMENRALHYAAVETGLHYSLFLQWVCVFLA